MKLKDIIQDNYFTVAEVAERSGLSVKRIRQSIVAKDLAVERIDGRVYISKAEYERYYADVDGWLPVYAAAKTMGKSPQWLYKLIENNVLTTRKFSGKMYINPTELSS